MILAPGLRLHPECTACDDDVRSVTTLRRRQRAPCVLIRCDDYCTRTLLISLLCVTKTFRANHAADPQKVINHRPCGICFPSIFLFPFSVFFFYYYYFCLYLSEPVTCIGCFIYAVARRHYCNDS